MQAGSSGMLGMYSEAALECSELMLDQNMVCAGNGHAAAADTPQAAQQPAEGSSGQEPPQLSIPFKRSGLQNLQRPVEVGCAVRFQVFSAGKQQLQAHKVCGQPTQHIAHLGFPL